MNGEVDLKWSILAINIYPDHAGLNFIGEARCYNKEDSLLYLVTGIGNTPEMCVSEITRLMKNNEFVLINKGNK